MLDLPLFAAVCHRAVDFKHLNLPLEREILLALNSFWKTVEQCALE
jgi:hypothetical protein